MMQRNTTESMAVTQLSPLQPNASYIVEAFSMMGEEKLHSFGIPLDSNLVTPSSSSPSEQTSMKEKREREREREVEGGREGGEREG